MDDYVAANPVPEGDSPNAQDWSSSISQMERNRWIVSHWDCTLIIQSWKDQKVESNIKADGNFLINSKQILDKL
jgi:hypothetical protein